MKKVLLICLLCVNAVYSQEKPWRFIKETDGIKVYFRSSEKSNINEVKIQTTFKSNLSTIVEALMDVDNYPNWVYKAVKSKTIKVYDLHEVDYYNNLDFPWPLDDRDILIHTKITQSPQSKIVTSVSSAHPEKVAEVKGVVRIKEFNSKWTFIPKNDQVVAEYVFKSNPGGSLPAWLINLSLDEGPIKTIKNFKKQLLLEKYKKGTKYQIQN